MLLQQVFISCLLMTRFSIKMDLTAQGLNAKEEKIQGAFLLQNSINAALVLLGSITAMDLVWRALQVIKIGNLVINVGLSPLIRSKKIQTLTAFDPCPL